jgi:hypothetical protein
MHAMAGKNVVVIGACRVHLCPGIVLRGGLVRRNHRAVEPSANELMGSGLCNC